MAGPLKKRNVDSEEGDSNSGSGNESDNPDIYNGGEVIEADFEGRNPDSSDFHGIKQLMQQLFLKAHIDLSQLSDMIIAQSNVGSVLKQSLGDVEDSDEDDDMDDINDVFGVTTVINLTEKKVYIFDILKLWHPKIFFTSIISLIVTFENNVRNGKLSLWS